ncbi:MAG: 4Fe-4S dicluster domain-containing protein [Deltaproteobacteria bacterium]|nr:4Fe-4S dicluster domain-containing protein [Deltaproteobacteria bacterium]
MRESVYSKEEWTEAVGGLAKTTRVFVPVKEGDIHAFRELKEGREPDFAYQNTRLSPKGIVYPPSERMFDVSLDETAPDVNIYREAVKDFPPQILLGIRPCDAHGFQIVKRNFDNPEYRDPWWVRRFESTTLVGLGCNEPRSTCFCHSVGGGPFHTSGLDAIVWDLGDRFLVKAMTRKGESFLKEAGGGAGAGDRDLEEAKALEQSVLSRMGPGISTERLAEKSTNDFFEAPFWEEVAFGCIHCGTCTYLCPTCWCFDIQDEVQGKRGDRIRNWDSCMFPLFTLHGSGHNPRDKKSQRVRQRFMHKLKYYVDKYRQGVQCSGCGRCVRHCPVNIDIREVAARMNGDRTVECRM